MFDALTRRLNGIRRFWMIVGPLLVLTSCQSSKSHLVGSLYDSMASAPSTYRESFNPGGAVGWTVDDPAAWQIQADRYRAQTRDDSATVSLYTDAVWTNLFFEVDYIRSVMSVGAGGLVVRATRDFRGWISGSGYLFAVGSDGAVWQYAVFRQVNGSIEYVKDWATHDAIQSRTNNLAALVRGDLLQFYINRELVWEGRDKTLAAGYAGVMGSTPPGQETLHYFDEAVFRTLPGGEDKKAKGGKGPAMSPGVGGDDGRAAIGKDKSPLLRPGLLVRVTVLVSGKREIDAEVKRVTDNSALDLPLIGPVSVQGMTLRDLTATLQERYQDYFIEPQVLAEFVFDERPDSISPWGSVVVLGRVRTPGRVNIPPTQDLTVSAAIQQAGGLDTSAKATAIRLTRRKPDGSAERITIDFSAVGQRGTVENDLPLKPGDVIFVPESIF